MKSILCSALSVLLLVASPNRSHGDSPAEGQVVFDCFHVNWAWGYVLEGFYIDRSGHVYRYNRNGDPWVPESVKRGTPVHLEADLLDKFRNSVLIERVGPTVLAEKLKLIPDASRGTITTTHTAYDAGGTACLSYVFDVEQGTYTEVMLGSSGDYERVNSSRAAQELSKWLRRFWELARRR